MTFPDARLSVFNFDEDGGYILWKIWDVIHPGIFTVEACTSLLHENQSLHQTLRQAHRGSNYEAIRRWDISKLSDSFSANRDKAVSAVIQQFCIEHRPRLVELVKGRLDLASWIPPPNLADNAIREHLVALQIPCDREKPNLLLHNLGAFVHQEDLSKRLGNIFQPRSHTFLVNTSGSGKTRLLLEGLCANWGLYFTSDQDPSYIGSCDVKNGIEKYLPASRHFSPNLPPPANSGHVNSLEKNRAAATSIFQRILLARLIIFRLYLDVLQDHLLSDAGNPATVDYLSHRQRWILLQIIPSAIFQDPDVFDTLSRKLFDASLSFVTTTAGDLLKSFHKYGPLFCVLDEAQHAATQHTLAFRSNQNDAHRPVLREIVRAWENLTAGNGVSLVVAGTGISKDVVDNAMASAISKEFKYRWCSDTGGFDTPEVQKLYLLRYLPPSLVKSRSGARLVERTLYWLRGRYRFTAGYVFELLVNGFQQPHGLLNEYIKDFSLFTVTDAPSFLRQEPPDATLAIDRPRVDFSKLIKKKALFDTVKELVRHYMARGDVPRLLGADEQLSVQYGFARFADENAKKIAMNEPLILLHAMRWLDEQRYSAHDFFASRLNVTTPTSNGFENHLACIIDVIFSTPRKLSDIFTFAFHGLDGKTSVPEWTNLTAELVSVYRTDAGELEISPVRHTTDFSAPSCTLGVNAKDLDGTAQWLRHRSAPAICFPHNSMGPDLLFVLRLSDGSCLWVALQAKHCTSHKTLPRSELRRALRSVTPRHFFLDSHGKSFSPVSNKTLVQDTLSDLRGLPNKRRDAGEYSLIRVIASWPADPKLKRCVNVIRDPDIRGVEAIPNSRVMCEDDATPHPIAALNMDMVDLIMKSQTNFARRDMLARPALRGLSGPYPAPTPVGAGGGHDNRDEKTGKKRRRKRSPSTDRPSNKRTKKVNLNS